MPELRFTAGHSITFDTPTGDQAQGATFDLIIYDITPELWAAMDDDERAYWERFTRDLCGEEAPDADAD